MKQDYIRLTNDILQGEKNRVEEIEKEQVEENVQLMEKPFDPTKIKIETKTPSLDTLIKRIKNKTVIEESQVVIYKILPATPTDVKFNIFKRINTGGLVLEPQEIRHALFQGKPATFIAQLANSREFLDATGGKIDARRMLDRDFVNRFLCFYLFGVENYGTKEYGQDIDSFMSKAMAVINQKTEREINKIEYDFKQSMILSKEIFGKQAFRKVRKGDFRLFPINKALFDAISVQFALLNDKERTLLLQSKKEVKEKLYQELHTDDYFLTSVTSSTSDKNRVIYRHQKIKSIIQKETK